MGERDVAGAPTKILELVDNERLVTDWPDRDPASHIAEPFRRQPAPVAKTAIDWKGISSAELFDDHIMHEKPLDVCRYNE